MSYKSKQPAIREDVLDKPLEKISAVELITAINATRNPQIGVILADKKKYELWVEENPVYRINLRELLDKLKGEKKKYELEFQDKFAEVSNPALIEKLADAVADRVAERVRG